MNTWLEPESGRIVLLQAAVLPLLDMYRQINRNSLEAGGILLGYRRDPHFEVVRVTEPGPTDIRSRTFFDRRDESHQRQAIETWRTSGCFIDYVGEWHTHPEPLPTPSSVDIAQWRSLESRTILDPMLELIIGTTEVWAGLIVGGKIRDLTAIV